MTSASTLFDAISRTDDAAPPQHRSEFAFMNITAIPLAGRLRGLLESAFAHYSGDAGALRQRIRADDNATHLAAVFELLLHELTRRRGLRPQADAPLGAGRPDIRLVLQMGHALLEARMFEPGNDTLYDQLCDEIDAVRRAGILYSLRLRDLPARQLSTERIRSKLAAHVAGLDAASLSKRASDNRNRAFVVMDGDQALIEVLPYAAPGSEGGVGVYEGVDKDFATSEEIRRGLERKGRKYKDANAPYIIALCSAKSYAEDDDFEEALFAQGRDGNRGYFVRSERANVSAILACQRFKPSAFAPTLVLYHNPNAAHPLSNNTFGCDEARLLNGELQRTSGASFDELMDLPAGWQDA